ISGPTDDHAFLVRLLVSLAANGRRKDCHLDAHRTGLAKEVDLVEQSVEIAAAVKRLAVVVHHHGHRADAVTVENVEQFLGLIGALALFYELGRHVFDDKPDRPQAAVAAERQQVLILEYVELGRLGAEKHGVAEWFAANLPFGHAGEDLRHGFAVVEEVVIGAEEGADAGPLGHNGQLVAKALGALEAKRELVVGWDRAIRAGKLAA